GAYEKEHTYSFFNTMQSPSREADVIHYPYFDPFFITLPLKKIKPTVVTVHDLIPLVFPDKFPSGVKGFIKWQIQKLSLLGVNRIITDSKASKADVSRITGYARSKIDSVYLAPDPTYQKVTDTKILDEVKRTFSLPERFILNVSDVNWNKNIPGLLQ